MQKNLTKQQKKFCEYYIKMENPCKAAIKAGYKYSTARTGSYKWLKKEDFQNYIKKLKKEPYSFEKYINELNEATDIAFKTNNPVIAMKIIEIKGQIFGFDKFIDTNNNKNAEEIKKTNLLEDISKYAKVLDKIEQQRKRSSS